MAVVGNARTSTWRQDAGLDAQRMALEAYGCAKLFAEQVSSATVRPTLERALDYVREGDVFVVTKIDRLARSVADLCAIIARLEDNGVALKILDGGFGTGGPEGRLFINILGAIAQFERDIMLARQRDGIAAAKAAGRYKGRKPTARNQATEVKALAAEGLTKPEIARRLGIGERSVYRILAAAAV